MTDTTFDNLEVSARRSEDAGSWTLGVYIDGAWWPFASRKLGGLDDDIARAKEAAARAAATAATTPTDA